MLTAADLANWADHAWKFENGVTHWLTGPTCGNANLFEIDLIGAKENHKSIPSSISKTKCVLKFWLNCFRKNTNIKQVYWVARNHADNASCWQLNISYLVVSNNKFSRSILSTELSHFHFWQHCSFNTFDCSNIFKGLPLYPADRRTESAYLVRHTMESRSLGILDKLCIWNIDKFEYHLLTQTWHSYSCVVIQALNK